jgi:hypothetical protein
VILKCLYEKDITAFARASENLMSLKCMARMKMGLLFNYLVNSKLILTAWGCRGGCKGKYILQPYQKAYDLPQRGSLVQSNWLASSSCCE